MVVLFIVKELKKEPNILLDEETEVTTSAPSTPIEKIEQVKKIVGPLPIKLKKKKTFEGKPRIALIIDDVGWNTSIINEIEKINQPFTLSILPKAQHSKEIFDQLKKNNTLELFLHQPMEPLPPAQSLDKGLLTVNMKKEELVEEFNRNLEYYYPYVKGVNNHMGSLFTTNKEKMGFILEEMKDKNLFFVDSMTSRDSCGYQLAKEMGIKTGKRDVFIDNLSDHKYIENQIWQLVEIAKKDGSAIGIGHARKDTVKVLKKLMPSLTEEVDIVPVSALME